MRQEKTKHLNLNRHLNDILFSCEVAAADVISSLKVLINRLHAYMIKIVEQTSRYHNCIKMKTRPVVRLK